ncbi:YdiU family protein [Sphingobacterium sp. DN00404]|uniref:Protein nucleotidyltransferase YdiU n=1 Tax=Sphingobacterium micropteri TaxID=2763501 RepID=A0ABR7YJU4_9SPHI|nr:YdiU family protein [Sphingobacterium micropteri]MBD1431557.1 YdiU family protein [Sphingobacterium micropteri]
MENLSSKRFKRNFVDTFPGDDSGNLYPRQTPGVLYSKAVPTAVRKPELIGWSAELADSLGIAKPNPDDIQILGGNLITPTMYPYAACYAGHQFGNWAGQLGDGRAITLGEWENPHGNTWELQLKGAGPTAYSRRADGRAVLRSSVREYLMSEAMHHLGIPTTRALALVTTGDMVTRDMFYDGRAADEPGAIVMRTAPSFLRFGNFEMLAARNEIDNLMQLVNWTIERFYPHIEGDEKVLHWFGEVVERTATMIVEWLRVGFVHGVMNTDNMSVLGLTIDYGPFSFLDNYDPDFTPNTTDLPGKRYAFGKQANVAYWNLSRLANALVPLISDTGQLESRLRRYEEFYWSKYYAMMANKLGMDGINNDDDVKLVGEFENVLAAIQPDMTIFYQLLIDLPTELATEEDMLNFFRSSLYRDPEPTDVTQLYTLITSYQTRLRANTCTREDSLLRMRKANPRFILRNYLLHMTIEELERSESNLFLKLQQALKDPYSKSHDEFFTIRPGWATQQAGCSMLSCSS